jgi:hypothetical protein
MDDKEIVDELIKIKNAMAGGPYVSTQGQGMDGYSALANFIGLAEKAEADRRL